MAPFGRWELCSGEMLKAIDLKQDKRVAFWDHPVALVVSNL